MKTKVYVNKSVLEGIKNLQNGKLTVGWFEDTKYDNGVSVAMVAEGNEYGRTIATTDKMDKGQGLSLKKGTITIPPRPFVRPTVAQKENEWAEKVKADVKKLLKGELTMEQVFDRLRLRVRADIQAKISEIWTPPLSDATIKLRESRKANGKASNKPLIEEGIMLDTISHKTELK